MNEYETTYIIDGSLSDEEVSQIVEQYSEEVKKQGGEITGQNFWGKQKLAYDINGKTEGFYVTMNFKSEPRVPRELERLFKLNDRVLRSIVVKTGG